MPRPDTAGRAGPASGHYRASIEPLRPGGRRTTAVVAVRPSREGQHCVEVERPKEGVLDGAAGRGARVVFEGRA